MSVPDRLEQQLAANALRELVGGWNVPVERKIALVDEVLRGPCDHIDLWLEVRADWMRQRTSDE